MDNSELRKKVAFADERIICLVSERLQVASEIGKNKKKAGSPVYNPDVEAAVIERYRRIAEDEGIDPDASEELARLLIAWSCRVQE